MLGGGSSKRFNEIAAEFVRLQVDVIVTSATAPTFAAKGATSSIPIVFAAAGDLVGSGLVASLAQPGGNITGLSLQFTDLAAKRLELLREIFPGLRRFAILANTGSPSAVLEMHEVEAAARELGLDAIIPQLTRPKDIELACRGLIAGEDALYVVSDPLINATRFASTS